MKFDVVAILNKERGISRHLVMKLLDCVEGESHILPLSIVFETEHIHGFVSGERSKLCKISFEEISMFLMDRVEDRNLRVKSGQYTLGKGLRIFLGTQEQFEQLQLKC